MVVEAVNGDPEQRGGAPNVETLATLLTRCGPGLTLYARQWCTNPEDVVQEALIRLAALGTRPANPVAWLYMAVRRRAITAGRAERRRRQHESAAAEHRGWFEPCRNGQLLDAERAAEALARLPDDQREVIVARLWGGLSFESIGELVGCSSSAAHRRYSAALNTLRDRLESR